MNFHPRLSRRAFLAGSASAGADWGVSDNLCSASLVPQYWQKRTSSAFASSMPRRDQRRSWDVSMPKNASR